MRFLNEHVAALAIGVLVLVVAFLLFKLRARKTKQVGSVVLFFFTTTHVLGQGQIGAVRQMSADAIAQATGSRASAIGWARNGPQVSDI
ncbi:MAG: hypothetical protein IPG11_15855 [Flavobacteriales bacterium]|nr:hypothetical protein [Flavobacteriales bacterium]